MATLDDRQSRYEAREQRRRQRPNVDDRDQNDGRPAAVAEREVVGHDGDHALTRAVDDARGDDAGRVAAVAHHHAQRLLAVRAGFAEQIVQVEGDTGQIAEVFQQREEREEDGHGRQHDRNDPGRGQVHAVEQQSVQPPGNADGREDLL